LRHEYHEEFCGEFGLGYSPSQEFAERISVDDERLANYRNFFRKLRSAIQRGYIRRSPWAK
jgi:hypothetical protein